MGGMMHGEETGQHRPDVASGAELREVEQRIMRRLGRIEQLIIERTDLIMSQDANIQADVATIEQGVQQLAVSDQQLTTAEQGLSTLITQLQNEVAAGNVTQATVDALAAAAADVTSATQANSTAVNAVSALVPPATS
jgi:ABC-type transporter Mla subunit MlaD